MKHLVKAFRAIGFATSQTGAFALILLAFTPAVMSGANMIVRSLEWWGTGFKDTTPVEPVGSNPGTTLGEQRMYVLQKAADAWGQYLVSDVDIYIGAKYDLFFGGEGGVVLASALAVDVFSDFENAPLPNVIYPVALANSYAGTDLSGQLDIEVVINEDLDLSEEEPTWYYGIDGEVPEGYINLYLTLLHEIGHGLGFGSEVDLETGENLDVGMVDSYTYNLFDTETQKSWKDMTNAQRKASAINDPHVVWAGPYTTNAVPHFLGYAREIVVSAPAEIAGSFPYREAFFGPGLPDEPVTGTVVVADDGSETSTLGCNPLVNAAEIAGNIAYIDRGDCFFNQKIYHAQQAGAVAVIVGNNVVDAGPMGMVGEDVVEGVTIAIPAISVSWELGNTIREASAPVTVSMGVLSNNRAGEQDGYVRMYAPNPLELGSSISHFTDEASPNLLMEPYSNPDTRENMDFSLTVMKDIGWRVVDIPVPHLTYDQWAGERFSPEATKTGEDEDADDDGMSNFEEYIFGGNPEVASERLYPVIGVSQDSHELNYIRSAQPAGFECIYEVTTDFINWERAEEGVDFDEISRELTGSANERVRLHFNREGTEENFFVRIRAIPLQN